MNIQAEIYNNIDELEYLTILNEKLDNKIIKYTNDINYFINKIKSLNVDYTKIMDIYTEIIVNYGH